MMFKAAKIQATYSFKLLICMAFVIIADGFFFKQPLAGNLGVYAFLLLGAVFVVHPLSLQTGKSRFIAALSAGLAAALVYDPGILAVILFSFSLVALLVMNRRQSWPDFTVLFAAFSQAIGGSIGRRLHEYKVIEYAKKRLGSDVNAGAGRIAALAAVPVIMGFSFIYLFASANPVVGNFFSGLINFSIADVLSSLFSYMRWIFWVFVWFVVWIFLRARFGNLEQQQRTISAASLGCV